MATESYGGLRWDDKIQIFFCHFENFPDPPHRSWPADSVHVFVKNPILGTWTVRGGQIDSQIVPGRWPHLTQKWQKWHFDPKNVKIACRILRCKIALFTQHGTFITYGSFEAIFPGLSIRLFEPSDRNVPKTPKWPILTKMTQKVSFLTPKCHFWRVIFMVWHVCQRAQKA